jgi:hypothetical protein
MKTVTASVQLLLAAALISRASTADDVQIVQDSNPLLVGSDLSNDFEGGTLGRWYDISPGPVFWQVEDYSSPIETNYSAPASNNSMKYLRINRGTDGDSAGEAIVRSPIFTVQQGDTISFSFWIQSRYPYGNDLRVNTISAGYFHMLIIP